MYLLGEKSDARVDVIRLEKTLVLPARKELAKGHQEVFQKIVVTISDCEYRSITGYVHGEQLIHDTAI
jgi:hypothetical protein